jgi:hypothetical protein
MQGYAGIRDVWKIGPTVQENARRLARLAALERGLMRIGAGQLQRLPEWEVKAFVAQHLYQDAEHADWLMKRIDVLRSSPGQVDRQLQGLLGTLLEEALRADGTIEYLAGIYGTLKPALVAAYRRYLAETNPLVDEPSCRLLGMILPETEAQVALGQATLAELLSDDAACRRAAAWQGHLQAYLDAAGGPLGDAPAPEGAALPPPRSKEPFSLRPTFARDCRFRTATLKQYEPATGDPEADYERWIIWDFSQEMSAAELVATVLFEMEGMPWPFYHDLARHCWDEARHSLFGQATLEADGVPLTAVPNWVGYAQFGMTVSALERYTHLVMGELSQMKYPFGKRGLYERFRDEIGRPLFAYYLDYDWADEVLHGQIGRRWVIEHTFEGDREAAQALRQTAVEDQQRFYAAWRRGHPEDPVYEQPTYQHGETRPVAAAKDTTGY